MGAGVGGWGGVGTPQEQWEECLSLPGPEGHWSHLGTRTHFPGREGEAQGGRCP